MKVIGVDYGERYVGIATGDTDLGIATPTTVIEHASWEGTLDALGTLIADIRPERIVIGLPKNFKGEETPSTEKAKKFGNRLRLEFKISVEYENEILSSAHAKRLGAPRRKSHAVAASLILQSWLDRNRVY